MGDSMKYFVAALALVVAGCSSANEAGMTMGGTRASQFPTGDGRSGWAINCDGAAVSITACYNRASALCPKGFDPISQNQQNSGGTVVANPWGGATIIQGVSRTLMVACKA